MTMRLLMLAACLCAVPGALVAQSGSRPNVQPGAIPSSDRDRLTIGLAGGFGPSYEGSDNYRFRPGGIIQGSVSGFEFIARGTNLYVDLLREAPRARTDFVLGPVVQLRLERDSDIRDARVAALGRIKPALELGLYTGFGQARVLNPFDKLSFDLTYRRDVSGIHRSAIVTPSISYATPVSRRTLALLSVSADHVGRNYGQTYFGVTPAGSVASGLAPYTIDRAGWKSVGGALLVFHGLSPDPRRGWGLFAAGGHSQLLGRYRRSPVVATAGSAQQWFGFAGVAYSF
jgi:MipA family protein